MSEDEMAAVLIMEDERALAEAWAELLKESGHTVFLTADAHEAMKVATTTPIDVVLTDILVRRDDRPSPEGGVLVIGRLRSPGVETTSPWLKDIPIIAISGAVMQGGLGGPLAVAKQLGATVALEKPVPGEELIRTVETLLANRAAQ